MRIVSMGHALFATILIAIGVAFLVYGDFGAIWNGVPRFFPARDALGHLCAVVSIACGIGLFWRRFAPLAARLLLAYLLLWMLVFKIRSIVMAPLSAGSYENWAETAVMVAGAWTLYTWFVRDRNHFEFAAGDTGVRIARVFYGLAMIAFGVAHYAYLGLTAPLVPGWLPWHAGWAYFFGGTYIVAGLAILGGVYARWAVVLSTVQMGLFTLLVWVPVVATGHAHAGQWSEFAVSAALTASGWVVADSYRSARWSVPGARRDGQAPDRLAKSRA